MNHHLSGPHHLPIHFWLTITAGKNQSVMLLNIFLPLNKRIQTNRFLLTWGICTHQVLLLGYLRLVSRAKHLLSRMCTVMNCGYLLRTLSAACFSAALINKGFVRCLKALTLLWWSHSRRKDIWSQFRLTTFQVSLINLYKSLMTCTRTPANNGLHTLV